MNKADLLIEDLGPEIKRTCSGIKNRKREKAAARIFAVLAAVFLILPALLIYLGVAVVVIAMPVVLAAAAFLVLSPVLFNGRAS